MEFMNAPAPQQQQVISQQKPMWEERDYLGFVKHYSEDDVIPDDLKKKSWAVFSKSLIYTFLENEDMPMVDIYNTLIRLDSQISRPAHLMNFKEMSGHDQVSLYLFTSAKRAIGTNREKMNERTLQNTQIGQSISTQNSISPPQGGIRGFLKKIF